ncbi:MAG: hypothetical protein Q9220_004286 [cf. Caloplaca sp. 1 TL-2023]
MRSPIFISLLSLIPCLALAASGSGSVSLFSNSDCGEGDTLPFTTPTVIALNYTLSADTCHTLDRAVHSYRVDYRPTCTEGSNATFSYYSGQDCQKGDYEDGGGPAYSGSTGGTSSAGFSIDGLCLALVEFNSFAFVCEGVGRGDASATSEVAGQQSSTSPATPDTTSTLSSAVQEKPTATPVTPGTSITAPPYTTSPAVVAPGAAGIGTGTSTPTGGLVPQPSPSPFTGAASIVKVSLTGSFLVTILLAGLLDMI